MACNPQSDWITVVQVGAATLSPVIAVIGGWIAWKQVRINRNKLKLDRFDKRFAIHEAAMMFVASIGVEGTVNREVHQDFIVKTRGARFLLSKEIADYMDELESASLKLNAAWRGLGTVTNTDERRVELGKEIAELTEWYREQFNVIPEKFAPFLVVDDI
jgi:hypothetical protein